MDRVRKNFNFDLSMTSNIEEKARGLVKRNKETYDFTNKNILIATPILNDEITRSRIYDVDKLRYCSNLRDVLYLKEYLCSVADVNKVEVVASDEDIFNAKKMEIIHCVILSHKFAKQDKEELFFALEENVDTNVKIIHLK